MLSILFVGSLTKMRIHLHLGVLRKLIGLLYQLATTEPFALPHVRARAASLLAMLLKKNKKTLHKEDPGDDPLILDPAPLFRLLDSVLFPPRRLPPSIPNRYPAASLFYHAHSGIPLVPTLAR